MPRSFIHVPHFHPFKIFVMQTGKTVLCFFFFFPTDPKTEAQRVQGISQGQEPVGGQVELDSVPSADLRDHQSIGD